MSKQESEKLVGDILAGMKIEDVPKNWTPLEAFVVVKCLNNEGRSSWILRMTEGINDEELLGSMLIQVELLKSNIIEEWQSED